jgi:hypothetical protein
VESSVTPSFVEGSDQGAAWYAYIFFINVPPKKKTTNEKLCSAKHATNKDKIPQLKVGKRAA